MTRWETMQKAGAKRKDTSPACVSRNEQKRTRVWRAGDFNSLESSSSERGTWIPHRPAQNFSIAAAATDSVSTSQTYSRATSAPPNLLGRELKQEYTAAERARHVSRQTSMHVSTEQDTVRVLRNENTVKSLSNSLFPPLSTTQLGIKQEVDYAQHPSRRPESTMATSIGQERAQTLAKRIRGLIDKRKEHQGNIDALKKRIRQSQLTYADLMRKRNRLETSLADLKVKLDSDEQLLGAEARIVDDIPAEIEQASAELAALISG